MVGGVITDTAEPLEAEPPGAVKEIVPVASLPTVTVTELTVVSVIVAEVASTVTAEVPFKLVPVIVNSCPMQTGFGEKLIIVGDPIALLISSDAVHLENEAMPDKVIVLPLTAPP